MRRAAPLALLLALLFFGAAPGAAQDALGGGADLEDGWEAILKLAPPSNASAGEPGAKKEGRGESSDRRRERESARSEDRKRDTEKASDKEQGEKEARKSRDRAQGAAPGLSAGSIAAAQKLVTRGERERREDGRERKSGGSAAPPQLEAALRKRDDRPRLEQGRLEKIEMKEEVPNYDGLVRSWHEPWPAHAGDQAVDMIAGAPPVLSIHPVGKAGTPYVLLPDTKEGGFNEAQLAVASQAFGTYPNGPKVSARLLDLIYRAARHFNVFHVHLVSGIRADRSGSRHSHGLAADIVLPGVSDERLAAYFRPQGFLGVGIYTIAGFVHVDVRERSYFWLDKSPPGRRTKIVQVRADEARMADEAAIRRGQGGNVNPPRLQKALHARALRRREKASTSQ